MPAVFAKRNMGRTDADTTSAGTAERVKEKQRYDNKWGVRVIHTYIYTYKKGDEKGAKFVLEH